jgi:transposase InsO family protein
VPERRVQRLPRRGTATRRGPAQASVLSFTGARHEIYPYPLRGKEITRPNQDWAMDITYIPMARGYVYLAVVLEWASRRVLSWWHIDHDGTGFLFWAFCRAQRVPTTLRRGIASG